MNTDPVAQAWENLWAAGEGDAAYDQARTTIETAPAATLMGVQAKLAVLKADLTYHFDALMHENEIELMRDDGVAPLGLLDSIEEALARLSGQRLPSLA